MRRLLAIIFFLTTFVAFSLRVAAADDVATNAEIAGRALRSCQEQYSSLAGLRVHGKTREMFYRGGQPNGVAVNDFVLALDRDGKRWRYAVDAYLLDSAKGVESRKLVNKVEYVWDGTKRLQVADGGNELSVAGISKGGAEFLAGVSSLNVEPGFAFGYLPGIGDLSRLEAVSGLQARPEMLDEFEVVVLSGKLAKCSFSLWLDPDCKYAPRRITIVGDREKTQLDDVVKYEVKVGALIEKEGHFFPTKYKTELVLAGGTSRPKNEGFNLEPVPGAAPETRMTADVELTEVEVSPHWANDAFDLQTKIPDGTQVVMLDAPRLSYKWVNKKAAAK